MSDDYNDIIQFIISWWLLSIDCESGISDYTLDLDCGV